MKHEAGLLAIYERVARIAIGLVNGGSDVAPQLLIFPDIEGKAPMVAVDPVLVHRFHRDPAGKDAMMVLVRSILDRGADAVLYVSEGWVRSFDGPTAPQQSKAFIASGIAPSESPERSEVLLVSVHTLARTWTGMMAIETKGNARHVEYAPLDMAMSITGRMAIDPPAHPN